MKKQWRRTFACAGLFVFTLLPFFRLAAQTTRPVSSFGAEFGFTSTNLSGASADYGATHYRIYVRHGLTAGIKGELGAGVGVVSGVNKESRLLPFEYRLSTPLNTFLGLSNESPPVSLYGGVGAVYYKRLAVEVQDHPYLIESEQAIAESSLWNHGKGWSFLLPVGLEAQLNVSDSHALTLKAGYNFTSNNVQQDVGGMSGFWGLSVGINIKPAASRKPPVIMPPIPRNMYARKLPYVEAPEAGKSLEPLPVARESIIQYSYAPSLCYEPLDFELSEAGQLSYHVEMGGFLSPEKAEQFAQESAQTYGVNSRLLRDSNTSFYKVQLFFDDDLRSADRWLEEFKRSTDFADALPTLKCQPLSEEMDEGLKALQQLADILRTNPELSIIVGGYADENGHTVMNQSLSNARSWEIKRYFLEEGIDAQRVKTRGYGEVRTTQSSEDKGTLARNRRIEIELAKKEQGFHTLSTGAELPHVNPSTQSSNLLVPADALTFDALSDELSEGSRAWLGALVNYMKTNPSVELGIRGYGDEWSGSKLNKMLAYARAARVAEYLLDHGVDYKRIHLNQNSLPDADETAPGRYSQVDVFHLK